jgi:hypothetical protein
MRSLFAVLKLVELQPEVYLGATTRTEQLVALRTLLSGYELALEQHDIQEPGRSFLSRLGAFVERRYGLARPAVDVVRIVSLSDDDAWNLFFELVWAFRDSLGPVALPSAPADSAVSLSGWAFDPPSARS